VTTSIGVLDIFVLVIFYVMHMQDFSHRLFYITVGAPTVITLATPPQALRVSTSDSIAGESLQILATSDNSVVSGKLYRKTSLYITLFIFTVLVVSSDIFQIYISGLLGFKMFEADQKLFVVKQFIFSAI
jgi:hypothetical protein